MHPFKKKVENKNVTIEIFVCFTGKFNAFTKKNASTFNEKLKKKYGDLVERVLCILLVYVNVI